MDQGRVAAVGVEYLLRAFFFALVGMIVVTGLSLVWLPLGIGALAVTVAYVTPGTGWKRIGTAIAAAFFVGIVAYFLGLAGLAAAAFVAFMSEALGAAGQRR